MRGDAIRALLSENRGSKARKGGARLINTKILCKFGKLNEFYCQDWRLISLNASAAPHHSAVP
jgi:hypothetical protein